MVQKISFFRFQAVLASKLAPTWVPKTGPKSTQNLANRLQICTSLQDAPKMAPNLEKHPKICKNLQKWYQHGRNMEPKFIFSADDCIPFCSTDPRWLVCHRGFTVQEGMNTKIYDSKWKLYCEFVNIKVWIKVSTWFETGCKLAWEPISSFREDQT